MVEIKDAMKKGTATSRRRPRVARRDHRPPPLADCGGQATGGRGEQRARKITNERGGVFRCLNHFPPVFLCVLCCLVGFFMYKHRLDIALFERHQERT